MREKISYKARSLWTGPAGPSVVGPQGERGEKGDKGDTGAQGPAGVPASLAQGVGYSDTAVMTQKAVTQNFDMIIQDEKHAVPVYIISDRGYYKQDTGVFVASTEYLSSELISVLPGETYYVTGTTRSYQTSLVHTYTSGGAHVGVFFLGQSPSTTDYTDQVIVIPSGVGKIGITTLRIGKPIGLKKYMGRGIRPELVTYGTRKYGVRYDTANPNDYGQPILDAYVLSARVTIGGVVGASDFDQVYPWRDMKRCNITTTAAGAKVVVFEDEAGFRLDGTNGDVFVRIPKFCVERRKSGTIEEIIVSESGVVHPAFIENDKELDEIFVGAFEGGMYGGKFSSVAGVIPASNMTPQEFLDAAKARGKGYTLYDFRTMDAIYCLIAVEFANRNTNRIFGYGISDYIQPTFQPEKLSKYNETTNKIKIPAIVSNSWRAALQPGMTLTICDTDQENIVAQRTIIAVADVSGETHITFGGAPVAVNTNCFIGSGAQITNWCETCPEPMAGHSGRADFTSAPLKNYVINPMRYRWVENLVGNLWHYFPDVAFMNGQMYVCPNIEGYEMHRITPPYLPVGQPYAEQSSNGNKSDIVGANFWASSMNSDVFAKQTAAMPRTWTQNATSVSGWGAYYYVMMGSMIVANGGGFDHLWRCNMLTNRAWIDATRRWYLYGARLQYKNI